MKRLLSAFAPLFAAVALALLPGCRLRDMRTVTISTPGIHNEACARRARVEILKLKGVEASSLAIDTRAGTVTVTYDSMQLGLKNLEHAICDAGFDANGLKAPPESVAALPASCMRAAAPTP